MRWNTVENSSERARTSLFVARRSERQQRHTTGQLIKTGLCLMALWAAFLLFALGKLPAQQFSLSQPGDISTPLNTPASTQITINDVNPSGVVLLGFSDNQLLASDNSIAISQQGSTRQITITPSAGQSGSALITIVGTNAMGLNRSVSFRLTVGGVNFSPTISPFADATIVANTSYTVNFTIADASPSTVSVSAASDNAVLVSASGINVSGFGTARTLVVTPNAGQFGSAIITVTALNQSGFSARSSFRLTVTQPPPAQAPALTTIPDLATSIGTPVSAFFNVLDQSGGQNVNVFANSSNTALLPDANIAVTGSGSSRQITLRPAAGQRGRAVVFVRAINASGLSGSTAFSLYVAAASDPPVVEGLRDTVLPFNTTITVPFKIFDANPEILTITPTSANPDIVPNANIFIGGSGINRTLTFTPVQNRFGEVAINVGVRNQNNVLAFGLLRAVLIAPPRLGQIASLTTPQNTPVQASFTLEDGNASTVTFSFSSSNPGLIPTSNISVSPQGVQGRTLTITPAQNQVGSSVITMTARNQNGLTSSVSFSVTVFQNQTPPTIGAIGSVTTARNVPVSAMFTVGDADLSSLRFTASSSNPAVFPASNVMVSGVGVSRIVTLTPAPNQVGSAQITLTVSNSFGLTASTSFLATVVPPPAPPTIRALVNVTTERNRAVSVQFVVSDENLATLRLTASSSNQTLFPNGNLVISGVGTQRTITMTPAFNQIGVGVITVTATNQQGQTDQMQITVTVVPPLLPPTISPIGNIVIGQNQSATRQFQVGDALNVNTLTFSFESTNTFLQPTNRLSVGGVGQNRILTVVPATDRAGESNITITATNQQGLSANTSFRLTVVPPPSSSQFAPPSLTTRPGVSTSSEITVNDNSGFPLTFSIQSSNEALVPVGNVRVEDRGGNVYRIVATPVPGVTGRARITVTISNGFSTTTRTLDVEVVAPPSAPITIPFLISPPNGSTGLAPSGIRFVWSRVPGALLYHVQVANDSLFDLVYLNNEALTDTTWFVTDFSVERQYFWRVRARFGLNFGGWSEVWTFRTGRARQPGLTSFSGQSAPPDASAESFGTSFSSVAESAAPRIIARLRAGAPNPFAETTTIEYELDEQTPVRLEITDALGKKVAELVNATQAPGTYQMEFHARNLPAGVYWCVLSTPNAALRQKMAIVK